MRIAKFLLIGMALAGGLALASPANAAPKSKHTIKASSRPYKALAKPVKFVARAAATTTVTAATFSFAAFDAAVVDPFGVALQAFADGVDMFVAQPLEALPSPLSNAGKVIHVVYLGIDKAGEVLAR